LFTPVFNDRSLEAMIEALRQWPQITMLEIGTVGWAGGKHLELPALLNNAGRISAYRRQLADAGLASVHCPVTEMRCIRMRRLQSGTTGCFEKLWS
jgi:hypothetical protein